MNMNRFKYHLAQLRHAYSHLKAGRVVDQKSFADGLISPAIVAIEDAISVMETDTIQVGWAYRNKRWDQDRWHVCGMEKPNESNGREIQPIFINLSTTDENKTEFRTLVDTISDEVWNHDASKDNCMVVDKDGLCETATDSQSNTIDVYKLKDLLLSMLACKLRRDASNDQVEDWIDELTSILSDTKQTAILHSAELGIKDDKPNVIDRIPAVDLRSVNIKGYE